MEIGDSFLVPLRAEDKKSAGISRLVSAAAKYKPKKFSARTMNDGIRMWRVE
jgi:hypothetical protein